MNSSRTIEEAAYLLSVHPNTVRRMIRRGELMAYRVGPRLIRITTTKLEAYQLHRSLHSGTEGR